jgi:ribosomal-protein-alanine N-acetyltransferase
MNGWIDHLLGRAEPRLSEAGPADAEAIAALHAASFHRGWSEDDVRRLLLDHAVMTHCAAINGDVTGFIMSRRATDEAEILSVAVESGQQGRGVGRRLLDWHLRHLAGQGTRAVFLEVEENNVAAIKLYRRAGFREVGRRPNYYPQGGGKSANALILRRDLV